jgi:hypothetical protein
MMPETAMHDHFESQATACDRLGSPFTGRLCRLIAELLDHTTATGRRVRNWPGDPAADALALRLCGAMHALVLSEKDLELGAVYPPHEAEGSTMREAVAAAIARHDSFVAAFIDSPPQTNEIARSAMLLPGLLLVARETGLPLALSEIGASAGLNLNLDRFHYAYGEAQWGDPASPVRLSPEIPGKAPPLDGALQVIARAGCDRMPVDISEPVQRLRLTSYLWPDQPYRIKRLKAAIAVAEANSFRLVRQDAADYVERELADRPMDAAFVLFHSIMWQYLPKATKIKINAALEAAGRRATKAAPLAHLRMEPIVGESGHALLDLRLWPGGETRRLAKVDFHGRWIEWLA